MTTATLTLTVFLLARIAEDETSVTSGECRCSDNEPPRADCPERVLAECEAKRRIVERLAQAERLRKANAEAHAEASRGGVDNQEQITALRVHGYELQGRLDGLRYAVDEIAAVYGDHPDYDPDWRP